MPCLSDIVPQNTKILLDNHFPFARSSENTWVKPSKLDRTIGCSKSVFDVLDRCPFPCLTREPSPLLFWLYWALFGVRSWDCSVLTLNQLLSNVSIWVRFLRVSLLGSPFITVLYRPYIWGLGRRAFNILLLLCVCTDMLAYRCACMHACGHQRLTWASSPQLAFLKWSLTEPTACSFG